MEEQNNFLMPKHRKLSDEECANLLAKYELNDKLKLPKIKLGDPALAETEVSSGDIVEITRTTSFAGESKYYRVVIE